MRETNMYSFLLPIVLLITTAAGALAVRSRPLGVRAGFLTTMVTLPALVLYWSGTSPLLTGGTVPMGPEGHWLRAIGIVWWFAAARLLALIVDRILGHDEASREARITSDLLCAGIYIAAFLVVLNFVLLLPVNGLVATSGIMAVVIGLALQNTLADVFSGVAVGIEHPFAVGHRISLGDGVEGVVVQVNWRSIRILTDGEDVVTIPNSVVAKAQIVNRSFPTERRATRLQLIRPATESPEWIMHVLRQAVLLCPDALETPAPSVTVSSLGMRSTTYAVDFFVAESSMIGRTKSLLLLHVHRQLRYAALLAQDEARVGEEMELPARTAAALMSQITLFDPLTAAQRANIAGQMTRRTLEEGDLLFREGAADDRLYVVASGVLEVTRGADNGARLLIGRIGAAEYIGEISMLTGAPHTADAGACTRTVVYELSRDVLSPLLRENVELAEAFERSVQRGLCLVERAVAMQAGAPPPGPGAILAGIRRLFGRDPTHGATPTG
jgi:small-conductance mechanosensitive channel/CRP-like cAMP-binding protein